MKGWIAILTVVYSLVLIQSSESLDDLRIER
jgi:hypothetical protein